MKIFKIRKAFYQKIIKHQGKWLLDLEFIRKKNSEKKKQSEIK